MSRKVKIVEVGARDGLQNEKLPISIADRWKLIKALAEAGLIHIEVGAFVSPKWVPQMTGTDKLVQKALAFKGPQKFSVLVPNQRGMEDAIRSGIKEVAIFGACTESFSHKNINCSIAESYERFSKVIQLAKRHKIKV
ncbi:MAG: hydroxymethylglutaryl-CoA lyase, partial [Bdellovibrionales bacterium]|nr:hydroxymethylglutaryl-CoA lyase [Bdellovibrionales bacterium]